MSKITLKALKDKFYVMAYYKHDNGLTQYKLYDKDPNSGRSQCHRFLDIVQFDSKRGIVYQDGSKYTDVDSLYKDIYEYANALEFHSDYYDPSYRVGIKEQMCIRDYMKSIGFESVPSGSYNEMRFILTCHDTFFGQKTMDISICVVEDSTKGVIRTNSTRINHYKWIEEEFDGLDDAIGKINSVVDSILICSVAGTLGVLKKISERRTTLSGSINAIDISTLEKYTANSTEFIVERLHNAIDLLTKK
jgi:hypothetical protein